jgi:hypothetical protein
MHPNNENVNSRSSIASRAKQISRGLSIGVVIVVGSLLVDLTPISWVEFPDWYFGFTMMYVLNWAVLNWVLERIADNSMDLDKGTDQT